MTMEVHPLGRVSMTVDDPPVQPNFIYHRTRWGQVRHWGLPIVVAAILVLLFELARVALLVNSQVQTMWQFLYPIMAQAQKSQPAPPAPAPGVPEKK